MVLDAYIRVSQKRDREGDSYISPAVQRESIENWARREGVTLGKVVKEENVSGGKAVKDRQLEELVVRCERKESQGIIVYRLNRFARSQSETHLAAKRIKDVSARLVAVGDGYDSEAPGGAYLLAFMAVEAEKYLEDVRQNWAEATRKAVDRDVHIACRAPAGYRRRDEVEPEHDRKGKLIPDGRLVVDEEAAAHVRRAFELRAEGATLAQAAEYLTGSGVKPGGAKENWKQWSKVGVSGLLKNPVYVGDEVRKGKVVKKDAHPQIVPRPLFAAVQKTLGKDIRPKNGSISGQALLTGLVVCDACGHKLRVVGSTNRSNGVRKASYTCAKHYATGDCPAPASARAELVDGLVLGRLDQPEELGGPPPSEEVEAQWLAAKADVDKAERQLEEWWDSTELLKKHGAERFEKMADRLQAELEEAQRRFWELDDPGIPEHVPIIHFADRSLPYEPWNEMPVSRQRTILRRYVAEVRVAKSDPKRRRWQPIYERVTIRWVGEPASPRD